MKKYFLAGLATMLPLAITIAIVIFVINFLTDPFMDIVSKLLRKVDIVNEGFLFLSPDQVLRYISKALILISIICFTLILGILTRWFFVKYLMNLGDKVLHKIPIFNTVYKTTQDITKTLFVSDEESFKQVVMVPFPNKDSYALGLVTKIAPQVCSTTNECDMISVLIPTTPNPTTGFLLMYHKKDVIFTSIKTEDVLKYIVSCGVITPPIEGT